MTATTETTAVSVHVKAFTHIEAALTELERQHKDVVHDCKTTAGDKAARKDRQTVQQHITSLEEKRVELKAPYLEAEREIDALAKGYAARLVALKTGYDTQIKAEETRRANVKRAAELEAQRKRDEAARVEREAAQKREQELREQNERLQAELAAARAAAAPAIEEFPIVESFGGRAPKGWERIEADDMPVMNHEVSGDDFNMVPVVKGAHLDELATLPETLTIRSGDRMVAVKQQIGAPSGCDDALLDLLDAGTAHAISTPNPVTKHSTRPAAAFVLPTAQQVADALTDHAKKRTSIRNVCDVLDAIRSLTAI